MMLVAVLLEQHEVPHVVQQQLGRKEAAHHGFQFHCRRGRSSSLAMVRQGSMRSRSP
jgi:hypothetical protein